jgi:hypothetical protein
MDDAWFIVAPLIAFAESLYQFHAAKSKSKKGNLHGRGWK